MSEVITIQPRLLSIDQVSQYLDLSVHTIYRMVSKRRIPYVKMGRLTKFDRCEIDKWIASHSVKISRLHTLTNGSLKTTISP
jgi:excisionase family DNA binding protein